MPFGWIMRALYSMITNYGMTLIVFTILFRALMFPVSVKTQKNTARQALLQPKLQKLKKQCGSDKQRYQQEMMKLQQEEGFSPFSSCLPMVIQMVLLFGIIDVVYKPLKHILAIPTDLIQKGTELLAEHGISNSNMIELQMVNIIRGSDQSVNAAVRDSLIDIFGNYSQSIYDFQMYFMGLNMGDKPVWGWNVTIIIPLLSGITALLMSFFTMQNQKKIGMNQQAGNGMMNSMMFIMPVFSTWIAFNFPMGIGMYWMVGNICMIVTNMIVYRIYTPEKIRVIVEQEKKAGKKKKSRYAQMMEGAMNQQDKNAPSAKQDQNIIVDGKEVSEQDLTSNQKIALARKRMAEKYGDDDDSTHTSK